MERSIKTVETREEIRITLPYRELKLKKVQRLPKELQPLPAVLFFVVISLTNTFLVDSFFLHVLVWVFVVIGVIFFLALAASHKRYHYRYLTSGETRSSLVIANRMIRLIEDRPSFFEKSAASSFSVAKLRVLQLPVISAIEDSEGGSVGIPTWRYLNQNAEDSFALVAENNEGRQIFPLAVAYPEEVMIDLARKVKDYLDEERWEYVNRLQNHYPPPPLPDLGDGIPICMGPPSDAIRNNPKRPDDTGVQLHRDGGTIRIEVPRGEYLESAEIVACKAYLQIRRSLLLGEVNKRINAEKLIGIRAEDNNPLAQDDVQDTSTELVIDYVDASGRKTSMRMLGDLSLEELCWIEQELKRSGPTPVKPGDVRAPPRYRFSIVQLLFCTALAACCMASFSLSVTWGWLYGATLLVLTLSVTSFTGYQPLGPFTRKSWSVRHVKLAISVLAVLWVVRMIAMFIN